MTEQKYKETFIIIFYVEYHREKKNFYLRFFKLVLRSPLFVQMELFQQRTFSAASMIDSFHELEYE